MFLNPDDFIKTVNSQGCSNEQLNWLAISLLDTNFPDDLMNAPNVEPFFMFSSDNQTLHIFIHKPGGIFETECLYSGLYPVLKHLSH